MRYFVLSLCLLAFAALHVLYGGTLPVYGIPGYLLLALAAIISLPLLKRVKVAPSQLCLISGLLFGGYLLIRAFLSPVPILSWRDLFSIQAALIVYVLFAVQLFEPKHRLWTVAMLCILLVVETVIGVIQFTRGDNFMVQGFTRADYGIRASGLFICPNHFAGFAEVVSLLAFALVVWGRVNYMGKILFGYCGCVGLVGVVLSGSRGGYLSMAAGAVVLVILSLLIKWRLQRERLWRFISVVVVLALLGGGGVAWIFSKSKELQARAANIADTNNMRTRLWASAWKQHLESPIVGTGAGTFYYYGRRYRDPLVQHDPVRVHNDYIELLAEYGWLGAGLFLLCLVVHVRRGFQALWWLIDTRLVRSVRQQSNAVAFTIGALAAIGAYLVHSVVDFNMHIPANAALMAFVFAILANAGAEIGAPVSKREPVFALAHVMAALLGIALLIQLIPNARSEFYGERARLALKHGDLWDAVSDARKAIPSLNGNAYYVLGEARRRIALETEEPAVARSFLQAAEEAYRGALLRFPFDSYALLRLGQTLDLLGKYDEAETVWESASRWDPNLARFHSSLGLHYHLMGKEEQAREEYRKALKLKGNQQMANAGLQMLDAEDKAEAKQ